MPLLEAPPEHERHEHQGQRLPGDGETGVHAWSGLAGEVETLACQYWTARQIGKPKILSKQEMNTVLARFRSYGKQAKDLGKGEALAVEPPPRRDAPSGGKAAVKKNPPAGKRQKGSSAVVRKPAARKRVVKKAAKAKAPGA